MKILHTTDLHFNKNWFYWLEKEQNNFDVFCITGDFLDNSKKESLSEQIKWITKWMENFKKPLFICSGNHDIEDLDNENWLSDITNVYSDNNTKIINGIKFGCIPYIAPEFSDFDDCKIILNHVPPAKTKTAIHKKIDDDWGDEELRRILQKKIINPFAVLCGHMHYPRETIDKINDSIIYNPGVSKKDIPNYHIIEL